MDRFRLADPAPSARTIRFPADGGPIRGASEAPASLQSPFRRSAAPLPPSGGVAGPPRRQPCRSADQPAASPSSASSTFAGWSAAFATRRQRFATVPSGATMTVDRITPTVFFPYIVFSPQAP